MVNSFTMTSFDNNFECENEETAWLYYLPHMTESEEQETENEETEEQEAEIRNLEPESNTVSSVSSNDESFSDPSLINLPPRPGPLRLADLFDEVADNDDEFIPFTRPYLNIKYISFDQISESETKYCVICFEDCPKKNFVYFKEKWMVGNRCCMQNYMCEDCFINTIRHAPNQMVCCPFCRQSISNVETHNLGLNQRSGDAQRT